MMRQSSGGFRGGGIAEEWDVAGWIQCRLPTEGIIAFAIGFYIVFCLLLSPGPTMSVSRSFKWIKCLAILLAQAYSGTGVEP